MILLTPRRMVAILYRELIIDNRYDDFLRVYDVLCFQFFIQGPWHMEV